MRCHGSKILRDPIRVPTLSLRRGAPFMHIKRKEGLKILEMGDYVRQRVTHMIGIIVPIFSLFNLSILAKVYSNIPTWTLTGLESKFTFSIEQVV